MPAPSPKNSVAPEISIWSNDLQGTPRPEMTIAGPAVLKRPTQKHELVTITVTKHDYAKLKAAGGPHPSYINMALSHYLRLIKEAESYPLVGAVGWRRGPVMSFMCAIPNHLSDEIRLLAGRFDSHTIEAVRLYLL